MFCLSTSPTQHRCPGAVLSGLLAALMLSVVSGCPAPMTDTGDPNGDGGGDGSPIVVAEPTTDVPDTLTAKGKVELPPGLDSASTLKVSSFFGEAAVASDGQFKAAVPAGGSSMVYLGDADGNILLLGYVNPDVEGPGSISAHETAVVLLFIATGGFQLPAAEYVNFQRLIREHPAAAQLAALIETKLAADRAWLNTPDQALVDAIFAAAAQLTAPGTATSQARRPALQSKARSVAQAANPQFTLSLIEPAAGQHEVDVLNNPAGNGIILQNRLRRYASYYIHKTGYKDENGDQYVVDPPTVLVDGLRTGNLSGAILQATQGLDGAIGSIADVPVSGGAYVPKEAGPIELPIAPGEREAYYEVIVLGGEFSASIDIPDWARDLNKPHVANWHDSTGLMISFNFFSNVLLPATLSIALPARNLSDGEVSVAEVGQFSLDFLTKAPEIGVLLREGEWGNAAFTAMKAVIDNPGVREIFVQYLRTRVGASAAASAVRNLGAFLNRANNVLAVVDVLLSVGDVALVVRDNAFIAEAYEKWDVKVINAPVRLQPTRPLARAGGRVNLLCTAPLDGAQFYTWTSTGQHGTLVDALGHEGRLGFMTSEPRVTYVTDAEGLPDGELDTIRVEVFVEKPGGGSQDRLKAGEASSAIQHVAGCPSDQTLVEIPFEPLRNYVAARLGVAPDQITCGDMQRLTDLDVSSVQFTYGQSQALDGLQYATNLKSFRCNFCSCGADSFDVLATMSELTHLDLGRTNIGENMGAIANATQLDTLILNSAEEVRELSALADMSALRVLDIVDTDVQSLDGLEAAANLEKLYARGAVRLADISGIRGASRLTFFDCYGADVMDLSPLSNLGSLQHLDLEVNDPVSSLISLSNKPELEFLSVTRSSNSALRFSDLTPLAGSVKLKELYLNGNPFPDVGPLAGMIQLKILELAGAQMTTLDPLESCSQLTMVELRNCSQLSDISAMGNMQRLLDVTLSYTKIPDLQPFIFANLGHGVSLNISCTPAANDTANIDALRQRGVFIPAPAANCGN